jgi:SAM-dependent methyltransferase
MSDLVAYNAETYERLWRYAHFRTPDSTPWWPLVSEMARHAERRLEIGPGPWPKLPVSGTHVVELAESALAMLRERGAIVAGGLLHQVSLPEASFDLVGIFEVLEHVPDDEGLIAEVARITRPGGHVLVAVPLKMERYNAFDRFAGHVRRYEPDELRDKLARGGFALERFEVRREPEGQLIPWILASFCRWFPRFAMWVTEQLLLPAASKTPLKWHEADAWRAEMPSATLCTLVCRRVAH